jgi:methionyl-tRNA synthetase
MNVGQDSDFSHELFLSRYNNDLGNDFGNLVSRTINMLQRYCGGVIPAIADPETPESEIMDLWTQTQEKVLEAYNQLQFHKALEDVFTFICTINKFLEIRAPWKLAKSGDPKDQVRLSNSLAVCAEGIRLAAAILAPILPNTSQKISEIFKLEAVAWGEHLQWNAHFLAGKALAVESLILFPRIA